MKQIPLILAMSLAFAAAAKGESAPDMQAAVNFDSAMLWGGANGADLSRFNYSNALRPGNYIVDIYANNYPLIRQQVRFVAAQTSGQGLKTAPAVACFTYGQLEAMQVRLRALDPALVADLKSSGRCEVLGKLFPDSRESFDFGENRLEVSIPQAYTINRFRRDISPDEWDSGITAFRLGYQYNYADYIGGLRAGRRLDLNLYSGFNFKGWYLRNSSTLGWGQGRFTRRSQRTSLQTDIPSWRARLVFGDVFSSGEYFAPYSMRGMLVGSDTAMLPYSERLYRPTIRGVARTRANVKVYQAGVLVFQDAVPPGPFAIDDYSPASYGGDLRVVVTEANGTVQTFTVPYASAVRLILPGQTQWSFSAGRYRNYRNDGQDRPWVTQLTGRHGVADGVNLYGGLLIAQAYQAGLAGLSWNTPWGAMAADATLSRSQLSTTGNANGSSLRFSYSKTLSGTNTAIRLATLRYSSSGFWNFADAVNAGPVETNGRNGRFGLYSLLGRERPRGDFSVTLSQPLGGYGSLYVSGLRRTYWGSSRVDQQTQLGYSTQVGRVGVNLDVSRTENRRSTEHQVMLNLSIPLYGATSSGVVTGSLARTGSAPVQQSVNYSGMSGERDQYTYGLGVQRAGTSAQYALNGSWSGTYGEVSGQLTHGRSYSQYQINGSGGLVAHAGGVTFGQYQAGTIGLIQAEAAAGAKVVNTRNAAVDRSGYGLVSLTPYSLNEVELSPQDLPLDVQLESTVEQVIPRAGAVVALRFPTRHDVAAMLVAEPGSEGALVFGTEVRDGAGKVVGVAGQGASALVRGVSASGTLEVTRADGSICRATYDLKSAGQAVHGLPRIALACAPQDGGERGARAAVQAVAQPSAISISGKDHEPDIR
ncbi:fimbria/pilus outer membrane usher protein [Bordetella bronchiseptica]|uniref:fimbria/pilus outer membrane usher protein n=1 Tax=Bordetella bronchiseptica TaxID=518 RepID=UPI0005289C4E|nr:fimbria/pilus outer membrane usher protein [Bordetella bronchiseptica]